MKIKNQKSKIKNRLGRRGSVIVLVVAVLALLAVIGTVYIVSARSERSAASASNTAENLGWAQNAANEQVLRAIAGSVYDASGQIAGYSSAGGFGARAARTWDIPEFGIAVANSTDYNAFRPDEAWLVSNLYLAQGALSTAPFNPPYNDVSLLTTNGFNPSTGANDIPFYMAVGMPNPALGTFRVVCPPNLSPAGVGDDAFVQLLPFSEANGTRYRIGVRILDTSRMANLNVGAAYTFTSYNNLPTYLQNGTYFNGYLLANPNATFDANNTLGAASDVAGHLNVTAAGVGSAQNSGRFGAYDPTAFLSTPPIAPLEYVWQQQIFRFESPVRFPAALSVWDNHLSTPFDAADELALRSNGLVGTLAQARAASASMDPIWPNTLGNTNNPPSTSLALNTHRGNYTAYSISRNLRSFDNPASPYQLSGMDPVVQALVPMGDGVSVYPPYPARVSILPDIATYTHRSASLAADDLAIAATNIATAMEQAGFTRQEACSFAANYLTYRAPGWTLANTVVYKGVTCGLYSLPGGPSVVDDAGLLLRMPGLNRNYGGTGANDLKAERAQKAYLGYAAQPFINEMAVDVESDASGAIKRDYAIELYNPYNVALSLNDYNLNIAGTDYSMDGKGWYVPPRGYFVLTQQTGMLDKFITNADAQKASDSGFSITGKVLLTRKYTNRAGAISYGAIDLYDGSPMITDATNYTPPPPPATSSKQFFEARNNSETPFVLPSDPTYETYLNYRPRWEAAVHTATFEVSHTNSGTKPDRLSLGDANDDDGSITTFLPLYDRVVEHDQSGVLYDCRLPLDNIADFNRIMRVCNQIDLATAPAGQPATGASDEGPISAILFNRISAPAGSLSTTQFPADAGIHFDFKSVPALYSAPGIPTLPNPNAVPPTTYKPGDLRAAHLLDCLSIPDRVSDFTIDIGDNTTKINGIANAYQARGISKLALPGQINVNTAPAEVLATIPVLGANPNVIGLIMAYRWRTNTNDNRIPAAYRPASGVVDFGTATEFPGYGIRSLGELQVPLLAAFAVAPGSLNDRDQLWAAMASMLTVRSDTFIVYAYLEAVRQNPRYIGPFNNSTNWYLTSTGVGGAVSDDPTDSLHPLFRVARKRWVALVDRSQANYGRLTLDINGNPILDTRFTQPRIIAVKDLPQ